MTDEVRVLDLWGDLIADAVDIFEKPGVQGVSYGRAANWTARAIVRLKTFQKEHDQLTRRVSLAESTAQSLREAIEYLRPAVWWFARQMEAKLRKRDHRSGWIGCAPYVLMDRLLEEYHELDVALKKDQGDEGIIEEAADVANFAMMIADNIGPKFDRNRGPIDVPGIVERDQGMDWAAPLKEPR